MTRASLSLGVQVLLIASRLASLVLVAVILQKRLLKLSEFCRKTKKPIKRHQILHEWHRWIIDLRSWKWPELFLPSISSQHLVFHELPCCHPRIEDGGIVYDISPWYSPGKELSSLYILSKRGGQWHPNAHPQKGAAKWHDAPARMSIFCHDHQLLDDLNWNSMKIPPPHRPFVKGSVVTDNMTKVLISVLGTSVQHGIWCQWMEDCQETDRVYCHPMAETQRTLCGFLLMYPMTCSVDSRIPIVASQFLTQGHRFWFSW